MTSMTSQNNTERNSVLSTLHTKANLHSGAEKRSTCGLAYMPQRLKAHLIKQCRYFVQGF